MTAHVNVYLLHVESSCLLDNDDAQQHSRTAAIDQYKALYVFYEVPETRSVVLGDVF